MGYEPNLAAAMHSAVSEGHVKHLRELQRRDAELTDENVPGIEAIRTRINETLRTGKVNLSTYDGILNDLEGLGIDTA